MKTPVLPDKTSLRKMSETPPDLFKIMKEMKEKHRNSDQTE